MATVEDVERLLKANNTVIRQEIKVDIDSAKDETINSINVTLTKHQEQIDALKNKITQLEDKDRKRDEDDLQREVVERRHNIILYKIEENEQSQGELLEAIVKLLNESVEEGVQTNDIDQIYRVGKKKNDGTRRPVLVKFISLIKKESIMRKWKFFNAKNIQIFNDFPAEIRERRKEILPLAKLLKSKGMKTSVKNDKLIVNGEHWSVAKAQEFVDEPPVEMEDLVVDKVAQGENLRTKKRDRSSPASTNQSPSTHQKKQALSIDIQTASSSNERVKNLFLVPSPISSVNKLTAPFVTTPQKNMQYTTIIADK